MSDKIVFRMNVRKEVDVVRGSSGKRVCNNLGARRQGPENERRRRGRLHYRRYDISTPQYDQVLDQGPAGVWGQDWIVIDEQSGQLGREFGGFFRITLGKLRATVKYTCPVYGKGSGNNTWAMKEASSRK